VAFRLDFKRLNLVPAIMGVRFYKAGGETKPQHHSGSRFLVGGTRKRLSSPHPTSNAGAVYFGSCIPSGRGSSLTAEFTATPTGRRHGFVIPSTSIWILNDIENEPSFGSHPCF